MARHWEWDIAKKLSESFLDIAELNEKKKKQPKKQKQNKTKKDT